MKETLHIYIRCSTDKQKETSIDRQKKMGKKCSKDKKMKPKYYIDGGKSRFGGLDKREQLSELIEGIQLGSVKHLWVEDWSRLTGEVSGTQEIELMILDGLVKVYEGLRGDMEYQPDNVMERSFQYLKTMMGSSVKHDEIRKSISTRIDLHNQGYWMKGTIPFGYKTVDRKLVIDRTQSKWVKRIFDEFGNKKTTIRKIQGVLKINNIKSPTGLDDWSFEEVRIVLTNPIYKGICDYTDRTKDPYHSPFDKDRKRKLHPYEDPSKWEVHKGTSPRIIDDEMWGKVSKLLTRSKSRITKKNYLLHGKLHCDCGMEWVGRWYSKYDKPFYHCKNNERRYYRNTPSRKHLHQKNCNKPKRINGEVLDEFVWNNLISTLKNSSWIKERVKRELLGERYGISSIRKGITRDKKRYNKEMKSFEKNRVEFIKDRYLNKLNELDYTTILQSIDVEIDRCKTEIKKLDNKELLLNERTKWIDWLKEHDKQTTDYEKIVGVKPRRRIIDFYIDDIIVGYDDTTKQHTIDIRYKYPMVGDSLIRKGGNLNWDKWGNGYKIKKGETVFSLSSSNFFLTKQNYQRLLNGYGLVIDSSIPFLVFNSYTKTHLTVPSNYFNKLDKDRVKLHTEIMKLHNKGWGYTKIHHHLVKNGFDIGKSRTCVDYIIKKIKKRDEFLNQKVIEEYNSFDIEFMKLNL